jgi:hypothetical protein
MARHARVALAYDGKVKIVIDHGLVVMPFCTTDPCLPRLPGTEEPAHGCRWQHITEPNYIGLFPSGFPQLNIPCLSHRYES